jgi:anti-sigma B factor antagonist
MSGLITTLSHDILIIDFEDTKILDQDTVMAVEQELAKIAEDFGPSKILIDMNRIELMTSMMIGEFIKFNTRCTEANKQVLFCNLTPQIAELFKITRLDTIMNIDGTRVEAIKRLSGK